MKSLFRAVVLAVVLLLTSTTAFALVPTPGVWYNASESGRGFTIDVQNNTLLIASYVYTSSGAPQWYLSVGNYDKATHTWTGTLDGYSNGQCLGCSYKKPVGTSAAGGNVKIVFDTIESGTLFYPGGSSPIRHYIYGYSGQTGYFLGEWSFAFNNHGLTSNQWIVFSGYYTASTGAVYARGVEDGTSLTTIALAAYDTPSASFIAVIDDGTGYEFFYQFTGDSNRLLGSGTIVTKGTVPSALPYVAIGNRLLAQSDLVLTDSHNIKALGSMTAPLPDQERLAQMAAALEQFAGGLRRDE